MPYILLCFLLFMPLFGDKDGNGKCWQREKIQELHYLIQSTKHVEYGSVISGKNSDTSDFYFFTPKLPAHFDLIFNSNHPVTLHVGTSCAKIDSILSERNDKQFVLLDENIEETIYIQIIAESEVLTSYEFHVTVSLKGDNAPTNNYNTKFGSSFDCQVINGNVTCKR